MTRAEAEKKYNIRTARRYQCSKICPYAVPKEEGDLIVCVFFSGKNVVGYWGNHNTRRCDPCLRLTNDI